MSVRTVVYLVLEALALGILYLAAGLDLPHILMAFLVAAAVTVLVTEMPFAETPQWPRKAAEQRDGTRDDIATLSWSFVTKDNAVSPRAVRTVREVATTRLHLHGIDLDDPADQDDAARLLTPPVYDLLTGAATAPTMRQLDRAIDRLATIDPPPPTRRSSTTSASAASQAASSTPDTTPHPATRTAR